MRGRQWRRAVIRASKRYTVSIEIGDWGDHGAAGNASADTVIFTVKSSRGAVVWHGRGTVSSGHEEETG